MKQTDMDFNRIMKMLAPDADVQVYDLSTDEGLESYNKQLDELADNGLDVLKLFGLNGDEWIDGMRKLGQRIHDKQQEKDNKEEKITPKIERKEIDHVIEEKTPKFNRPSEKLSVNQKLQLHKIVQEYIDTMIKPYNVNGALNNQQINDAYAGLYEFAAWIMSK